MATGCGVEGQGSLGLGCGCPTYSGLAFSLCEMESFPRYLGGVMRNIIPEEVLGMQETGLSWVTSERPPKASGPFCPSPAPVTWGSRWLALVDTSASEEGASPAPQSCAAPGLATDSEGGGGRAASVLFLTRLTPDRSPSPQLLFLTGLSLIIGLRRTFSFFFQRHKLKGTSFFLGGVVIVLLRWPLLGMCLETYGFFSLFR